MTPAKLVELYSVTVDLPIYATSARSLRKTVLNASVGGRLMRDRHEHVVVRALDSVDLQLFEGDRLGLIGHNGSGKTTLLRTIGGIYAPSSGTALVAGEVSAMLDVGTGIDLEATGEENVRLLARYRGFTRQQALEILPEVAEFTGLGPYMQMPLKSYSQGMLSRLVFAVATSFQPDVLLMDEWITTGDELFVRKAEERLASFVSSARVTVLASHNHDIIRRFCNKVARMEAGKIVAYGTYDEVTGGAAAA
jgi:ABC-type polysaccharide/polyol phosphate transport system ATPase subunit